MPTKRSVRLRSRSAQIALIEADTCRSEAARVLNGDAYDLLGSLPNESVDLLITSPPYWGLRTYELDHNWNILQAWRAEQGRASSMPGNNGRVPGYDWYRKNGGILGLEPFPEWYVHHLTEIFEKAVAPLKPGGNMW